jgi:hypothetical protein
MVDNVQVTDTGFGEHCGALGVISQSTILGMRMHSYRFLNTLASYEILVKWLRLWYQGVYIRCIEATEFWLAQGPGKRWRCLSPCRYVRVTSSLKSFSVNLGRILGF